MTKRQKQAMADKAVALHAAGVTPDVIIRNTILAHAPVIVELLDTFNNLPN